MVNRLNGKNVDKSKFLCVSSSLSELLGTYTNLH